MLDRITSRNSSLAPFYLHVLDQIVTETKDNASLGESIGEYQGRILLNNTSIVVRNFIMDEKRHPNTPMWMRFAHGIARDIDLEDDVAHEIDLPNIKTYKTYSKGLHRTCRSHEEKLFMQRFLKTVRSESN